ncbi:hypothetical protein KIN20_021406 [Parelaphostrongylus tenuis]|uniref:Uncharacterized protein n=1 Tax=Parelaphostrongylus tenuis TaxID=148309 RepID=A0AAD5MNW6_PARTN|nr:hypothetical protein KIN20_021406 [Parelaphostrongylus tenuis]
MMLKELSEAGKKIGLCINCMRTRSMKSQLCNDEHIRLHGSLIAETFPYVYLGRSLNMENNMEEELDSRKSRVRKPPTKQRTPNYALTDYDSTILPTHCLQRRRELILRPRQDYNDRLTERLNDVFSKSVGTQNTYPACTAQILEI